MVRLPAFLSSNAQDFIEDVRVQHAVSMLLEFLSSNAQDFIEDCLCRAEACAPCHS